MSSRPIALRLATVLLPQLCLAGIAAAQPAATPADSQTQAPPEQPAAESVSPGGEPVRRGKRAGEEEIIVTGSRVRRKDLTTPAPVTVISREAVQASGRVTIGDFLQTLPEQGNAVNTQQNNGGSGATRIDLRGLGNVRTLVLINGRRLVNTGTGGASGIGVDLNTVPTAAVERIEILKDGASAVYGSDAIAGVINIITRKSYSGVEGNAFLGVSTHGDGAIYDVNATAGVSGDLGSLLFSAGYYDQEAVFAGNRDFSRYQQILDYAGLSIINSGSSRAPNGRVTGPGTGGNALWQRLASRYNCTSPGPTGAPRNCSFTYDPTVTDNWRPFRTSGIPPNGDLYNFQPVNYDITPSQRISLYTAGNAKLNDYVRAFVEGSYVNRQSRLQLAPEPLIIGAGGAAVTISPDSIYNPFGRSFSTYSKRLTEFGPRTYAANVDTFRVVTGLNGTVSTWAWDVSLNYGRTQWAQTNRGSLLTSHLQNAVGPSFREGDPVTGTPRCGTPGNVIAGCVPLDLFNGDGRITPDMVAYLGFPLTSRISNQMVSAQANFGGELPIRLLSERPVGLAVGYEYRFEDGADIPDPVSAAGESTGNNRAETGGHFYVNEGYGELSVPIVSGVTGAENVEGTAAVRVFNYNTFGTDATYKFGGRWSIIRDLTVRGTYSTAFRAPSITELFQGASDNFPSVRDPCANLTGAAPNVVAACTAAGVPAGGTGVTGETQTRTRNSGNANLKPETAKIWTAGVVIEPRYVRGLSLTLDYYNISVDKAIATLGASYILQSCYVNTPANAANCAKIHRSPVDFTIDRLDDFNENIGHLETAGIDLGIRYNLPTEVGRFLIGLDGTWLSFYNVTQPDGRVVHGKGNFDVGTLNGGIGGVYPTFKALGTLLWNYSDFGAGVSERFIGSFTECAASDNSSAGGACFTNRFYSRRISAYYQTDIFLTYDLKSPIGRTTIGAGIRNLFNSAPPRIYSAFTPTSDATTYDFMGRFFYGRLTQRF